MTPKEAIENITEIQRIVTEMQKIIAVIIPARELEDNWERYIITLNTAKKILEKQIAKKPDVWRKKNEWDLIPFEVPFGELKYRCPCCGNLDVDYREHHCKCGQKLDWSEEE